MVSPLYDTHSSRELPF